MSARTVASAQSDPVDSPPPQRIVQLQTPQSGSLTGRLTNIHSAPLAGISVVLRNRATGVEVHATTGKNGAFRFASLDAGSYTLDADAAQFGHGRLEEILVTGGVESRLQAAMNFEPAPPALLEASAAPPQIVRPPAPPAAVLPIIAPFTVSLPPAQSQSLAPIAARVAPIAPLALRRSMPSTSSPQIVAAIADEPLIRIPLSEFAIPDAVRPSTQPASPMPTPSQSATQPILPSQIAPHVSTPPATPTDAAVRAPTHSPTNPPTIVAPPLTTAPSTLQRAQLEIHLPVWHERAALETQSANEQLAVSAAPPRPFPLITISAPILATVAAPTSLLPAALLHLPPVAAVVAAAQPPDPVTPAVSTTMNASQLQALPASGRRWQQFLLDAPAASASASSSQASFRGSQESAEVTIDGANTRLAFGVIAGSGSQTAPPATIRTRNTR